jgi:predicted ATPase
LAADAGRWSLIDESTGSRGNGGTRRYKHYPYKALRLRGDLLLLTDDRGGAEASFTDAIAVARRQAARLFELRATTSLARLWRDQDKCAEARDLLAPVYGWFTEGFDTLDLREAKALLDELA